MPDSSKDSLPHYARSAVNRCNIPPIILGSLTFQQNPSPIFIDGTRELHKPFFDSIESIACAELRAIHFSDYMRSCFLLDNKDEAGLNPNNLGINRGKADYLRMLRGWMFNPDGIEAAVLKRWVESRFGLLVRNHNGPIRDFHSNAFESYQADYMRGLYNTNGLEAQLDLLYCFSQYELKKKYSSKHHMVLFRGINNLSQFEILEQVNKKEFKILLNNLNSFSIEQEQSDVFGDQILSASIPLEKIFYYPELLPGRLQGEAEFLVIGGVYKVTRCSP